MRILAVANAYCALTELRAHRPSLSTAQAEDELRRGVRIGYFDGDAVNAVLAAAGHHVPQKKTGVAGLSDREIEVLRLLAKGFTVEEDTENLVISFKTVDRHTQNIYTKINVSTRAAATLFAMENHLLTQ